MVYALRPKIGNWQTHFASVLRDLGFVRMQSDANVYVHHNNQVYILAYVDDLLLIGPASNVASVLVSLHEQFLLKATGSLDEDQSKAAFLGRNLVRHGDSISFHCVDNYVQHDFSHFGLSKCKPSPTPGNSSMK